VTAVNIWLTFGPGGSIQRYLLSVDMPLYWEGALLGFAGLHFVLAWLLEQTNIPFSKFVDWSNLKFYNWY